MKVFIKNYRTDGETKTKGMPLKEEHHNKYFHQIQKRQETNTIIKHFHQLWKRSFKIYKH